MKRTKKQIALNKRLIEERNEEFNKRYGNREGFLKECARLDAEYIESTKKSAGGNLIPTQYSLIAFNSALRVHAPTLGRKVRSFLRKRIAWCYWNWEE